MMNNRSYKNLIAIIFLAAGTLAVINGISTGSTGFTAFPDEKAAEISEIQTVPVQRVNLIPSSSIIKSGGKSYVYISSENTLIKREIETGTESGGYTAVITGLEQNDLVVVNPYELTFY